MSENEIAYNRHKDAFLKQFLAGSFYMLPKDSVRLFGASKAVFLAYLFDLAKYADYNNQSDFFATRDKISADLGFGDRIIGDYFAFFKEHGIIESYRKGTDPRKWYKINANKIFDFALKNDFFSRCASADSADTSSGKNCRCASADSACAIYNNKESIIPNSTITNSAERILPKKEAKKSKIDLANDYFVENSHKITNKDFDLELWIKWIGYKIKKSRNFGSESFEFQFKKLLDFESRAREAVEYSIGQGYQGLFLPKDSAPTKYKYDPRKGNTGQSDFSDNPDDYINENMDGVTRVSGDIFKADLWKLTGRKK